MNDSRGDWDEFMDCLDGENFLDHISDPDLNELADTGSLTIVVGERKFVLALHVEAEKKL